MSFKMPPHSAPHTFPSSPDWVADAIFYQIFPDRFARSDRVPKPHNLQPWGSSPTRHGFQGGDLSGVVEHLDHLQGLGVTAIYLNPIFMSASNHRCHTYDYYRGTRCWAATRPCASHCTRPTPATCASSRLACSTTPAGGYGPSITHPGRASLPCQSLT